MLDSLFLQILNMSYTASYVILFVLFVRLFLQKTPKIFSYILWSVVFFRLVCPFSFESMLSILPSKVNPIPSNIAFMQNPAIDTGIALLNNSINPILPKAHPAASINPLQIVLLIGEIIWLIGIIILLTYNFFTLHKLKKSLKDAIFLKENIYLSGEIHTAFVLGLVRPKIYLPLSLTSKELEYILLHEQTHIKRFDPILKSFAFGIQCIHWFNPLVWIAFFAFSKDMELSCDEKVIKLLGNEVKKDYSYSLLRLATDKKIGGNTPLAFGEGPTKKRIKNVLHYNKPKFWVIIVTTILVIVTLAVLISNPKVHNKVDSSALHPPIKANTEPPSASTSKPENTFSPLTYDQAIIKALSDTSKRYLDSECFGEGHIILGTAKKDTTTQIYTLIMVGYYGFINNHFEKISGSGIIPALVTLKKDNSVEIEYPQDGSYYTSSIKRIFPSIYHERIFSENEKDRKNLKEQEQAYAKAYLSKIHREAAIGDYGDFEHILLTDLGVSVAVSNKLEDFFKFHTQYPYFIGTKEFIENGQRIVYEMAFDSSQNKIFFKRYRYETKELLEQFTFDAKTGNPLTLYSS